MNKSKIEHFTIRVYALIINEDKEILVSDEFQKGMKMTKFPGGGMHFGEGTIDCIKREALEEFGQEIEVIDHFYTTEFFQQAYFYPDHQVISIYYLARFKKDIDFRISKQAFDFVTMSEGAISFRWLPIDNLGDNDSLTLPIDKIAGKLLYEKLV